jgi:hypothetical protein
MSQAILEHLGPGLARLRDKARTLLDSVSGLADRLDHEGMWTDTQFLRS